MKMKNRVLALLAAALVSVAACSPPKYVSYRSVNRDFTAAVPWGWQVMTDQEGDGTAFAHVNFIGPFDPSFYLGVPSMSVRWYRNFWPRKMRDGRLEMYASPDDFIKRTLAEVYGPEYQLPTPVKDIDLRQSGLKARLFVVLSRVPVPAETRNGVEIDESGVTYNVRQHAYVVVPMGDGFYVLTYPATRGGYDKYDANFNQMVSTFLPITRGPGGRKVRLPGPGKSGSAVDG
ncbi:MAG: hypothetical protein SF051_03380 [Elusimicrobiota bacterium]|nr:hypothetical protein [Elusimicrobiota bacterium]